LPALPAAPEHPIYPVVVAGAALAGEAQAAANASGSPTAKAQAGYALGLALEGTDPARTAREGPWC